MHIFEKKLAENIIKLSIQKVFSWIWKLKYMSWKLIFFWLGYTSYSTFINVRQTLLEVNDWVVEFDSITYYFKYLTNPTYRHNWW